MMVYFFCLLVLLTLSSRRICELENCVLFSLIDSHSFGLDYANAVDEVIVNKATFKRLKGLVLGY